MKQFLILLFSLCYFQVVYGRPADDFDHPSVKESASIIIVPSTIATPSTKLPVPETTPITTTKPTTTTTSPTEKKNSHGKLTSKENRKLQKQCGHYPVSPPKSINSESAVRKEAPWVVGLAYIFGNNPSETKEICSGTLISNRHVLTAWHCLSKIIPAIIKRRTETGNIWSPDDKYVDERLLEESELFLEKHRFVFDDDCSASRTKAHCSIKNATIRKTVKAVSPKILAKSFVPGNRDVAIFELDEPVNFGPDLYPACLSETSPSVSDVFDLYSYGQDERVPQNTLEGSLQHIQLRAGVCNPSASIDTICTNNGNESSDYGDSGGGLTYKKHGRAYVTGVISGGLESPFVKYIFDCAVAPHLSWICKHTGVCVNQTKAEQLHPQIDTITVS